MEIKSARYQREILSIWAHTAFDKIVDSNQGYSAEMKEKVKEAFDLEINAPNGVRPAALLNRIDGQKAMNLSRMVDYNLEELNRQFGVDFMYEWRNLNEVIGDTGGSVDGFYDSFEYLMKHTKGLEVDDLFPKLDEFKEYPEEFTKIVTEWLDKTNFDPIYMSVELDTTKADKWLDEFITKYNNGEITLNKQPVFPTPSNYAPQLPIGKDGKLDISIALDVENANVGSVKVNPSTVLRGDSFWVSVDLYVNNGK